MKTLDYLKQKLQVEKNEVEKNKLKELISSYKKEEITSIEKSIKVYEEYIKELKERITFYTK